MIGLLFLATVAVWLWACVWLSLSIGNFAGPRWRIAVKFAIFLALISSPFVDEVIGKHQFETLCKTNGIESADVSRARGKKVTVEYGERKPLSGTILPIKESDVLFRDADSGEILIRHKNYYADGGWLMRYTWISMGSSHPMLFGSTCGVLKEQEIFKANEIAFLYK